MGINRYNFDDQMYSYYKDLMNQECQGSKIWKQINYQKLSCVPAFVGERFDNSNLRLMYVGRAINGWERPMYASSSGDMAKSILEQEFSIHTDIVNKEGFDGYRHKNYNFWRLLRFVLAEAGDAIGGEYNWYDDAIDSEWNQKFIWSNLFKVAPYSGGNPDIATKKAQVNPCVDIIKAELDLYKPNLALFVTDNDGWFIPWRRYKELKSFAKIATSEYELINNNAYIVGKAKYNDTIIIVCKRPDRRGASIDFAKEMAAEIYRTYESMML